MIFYVAYYICNVTAVSLSGSTPLSYHEVFPRHSHAATHRFWVTASCAVRYLALAKVSHAPKIAGPEMTPSLHMKSCPSVAMRCDDFTIIK